MIQQQLQVSSSPFPAPPGEPGSCPEQLPPALAAASNNGRFLIVSSLITRKHLPRFSEAEAHKWLNCAPENSESRLEKEVTKQGTEQEITGDKQVYYSEQIHLKNL